MEFRLKFSSYIAEPYWAEREKLVTIEKRSGMNLARSEDRREAALLKHLENIGSSPEEYQELKKLAARPWYTIGSSSNGKAHGKGKKADSEDTILIPRHQLSGCLVQAAASAPAGARIPQDELRCILHISDFVTEPAKTNEDANDWSRFILPTDAKGNAISNQRRLTISRVLEDFTAVGEIDFDTGDIKRKAVIDLMKHAGKRIGAGASRKMGYGRFVVLEPEE
jgi:hypothetical protein